MSIGIGSWSQRSLRTRLLFALLIPIALVAAFRLYETSLDSRRAEAQAYERAEHAVRAMVADKQDLIERTELLLVALSQLPNAQELDVFGCSAFVARLRERFEHYTNLGIADTNGNVWCSGLFFSSPHNVADHPWFQNTIHTEALVVSGLQHSRIFGAPMIRFAYPVLNELGEVTGVAFAELGLTWFAEMASGASLPAGSTTSLLDAQGIVLAHYPNGEEWVGQHIAALAGMGHLSLSGDVDAILRGRNPDGQAQLVTQASLSPLTPNLSVQVAMPADTVLAQVRQDALQRMMVLITAAIILFIFWWYGLTHLVLQRVNSLLLATRRLRHGEFTARSGIPHDPDEFGQLAQSFDEMAQALEAQRERTRNAERGLREREELYRLVSESSRDLVCLHDSDGTYLYVSPSIRSLLGYAPEELVGTSLFALVHPEDVEHMAEGLAEMRHKDTAVQCRMRKKDGSYLWLETLAQPVIDPSGHLVRIQTASRDITSRMQLEDELRRNHELLERRVEERTAELRVANEQLQYNAYHDSLTGLANRARFMDRLQHAILREARLGRTNFAVLFLNFDRFKVINDSLGHKTGDALLIKIAHRLETVLRSGDTVARLGGDEFAILVEDIRTNDEPVRVAERIHQVFLRPFPLDTREIHISTSIGITLSDTGYERSEDVLQDANLAMYQAKAQGTAAYQMFEPSLRERSRLLVTLETDLRGAIDRHELRVEYQPILAVATEQIAGFEALVRWMHPVHKLVSPAEFIPIAEETGMIIDIDRWVLREACRQVRAWNDERLWREPAGISVNLSARQFTRDDLVTYVQSVLQETGLEAHLLKLEITESLLVTRSDAVTAALAGLRSLGVRLHIDDFGTGYSSLSYLQRFPAHAIKIDRSFIANMLVSQESAALVHTIISLADTLGMEVVAEGIETQEQLTQLRGFQCEYGQGYLFSKPLSAERLRELAQKTRL